MRKEGKQNPDQETEIKIIAEAYVANLEIVTVPRRDNFKILTRIDCILLFQTESCRVLKRKTVADTYLPGILHRWPISRRNKTGEQQSLLFNKMAVDRGVGLSDLLSSPRKPH